MSEIEKLEQELKRKDNEIKDLKSLMDAKEVGYERYRELVKSDLEKSWKKDNDRLRAVIHEKESEIESLKKKQNLLFTIVEAAKLVSIQVLGAKSLARAGFITRCEAHGQWIWGNGWLADPQVCPFCYLDKKLKEV